MSRTYLALIVALVAIAASLVVLQLTDGSGPGESSGYAAADSLTESPGAEGAPVDPSPAEESGNNGSDAIDGSAGASTTPPADASGSTSTAGGDGGDVSTSPGMSGPEVETPSGANLAGTDPEEILERAAAAYRGVESLRADFEQEVENPILRRTTTSRGTLFQRGSDRFLMRFSDPDGDVIVGDGTHLWIYYPSVQPDQVTRIGGAAGASAFDLRSQLTDEPTERFAVASRGSESVRGRTADVLELTPHGDAGFRRLVVRVDRDDALVRRFEVEEANGVVRRFELRDLEINPSLRDSLFEFTPPEGVRVIERG